MDIRSKWLRGLFALLMCASVGIVAGCADDATSPGDEAAESTDADAGSDDIGAGGVDAP